MTHILPSVIFAFLAAPLPSHEADSMASGDAFVRFDPAGPAWTCGTGLIEQRLELKDGRFLLAGLRNRLTGSEYVANAGSDEFRFLLDGKEYTGTTGGYRLKDYKLSRLPVPRHRRASRRGSRWS